MNKSRPARARRLMLLVSMTATAVTFLAPAAEAATTLTVTKTASPAEAGSVPAGGTITYTIDIANSGAETATGVILTDATPADTTYVENSASINGGAAIGGATNPFADGEAVPDIAATGSATATFQVTVNSPIANGTTITNTASITADNADGSSDLSDDAVHTVASAPTLTVAKTSDPAEGGTVNPGDTIDYTIVVSNSGTDVADDPTLADDTPANTTYVAGSATVDDGTIIDPATNPFAGAGLTLADIPAGDSTTATFSVLVDGPPLANNTPISNTASADAANFAGPATDDADHTVSSMPGLTVDKTADPAEGGPVTPGGTITYTITVANDVAATETATGVVLTDDAPGGTTYVAGSATIDDGTTIDPATNPFADPGLSIDDLDPGETTTATFQVTVNRPLDNGTPITNTATISSDQGPDISNDSAHTVQSAPMLAMSKTAVPVEGGKVTPGTVIGYSMAITNDTTATEVAKGVTLTDPTPANTTYVEGSAKIDGTAIEGAGNPLASGYRVRDLVPGDTATISFDVKVVSPVAQGTVISNLAKLTADNHPDAEDGATHTVDSAPVLKVALTSDPEAGAKVKAGESIDIKVDISNDPAATDSLRNVTVTVPTPEGTTLLDARVDGVVVSSPTSRTLAPGSNPLSSGHSLGDMAPGSSHAVTYSLEVHRSADEIDSTVTIQASNMTAVTAATSHRGPNLGSGGDGDGDGGGGGGDDEGAAFGPGSGAGGVASGGASDELAFTGLDLARLLTLAFSLFLVGLTLMARGRSFEQRVHTAPTEDDGVTPGFPAWDRWAGAWFFPDKK